jgi:spore germination protein YaaH
MIKLKVCKHKKSLQFISILLITLFSGCSITSFDQGPLVDGEYPVNLVSTHQLLWEENRNYRHDVIPADELVLQPLDSTRSLSSKNLKKEIFGFYPHWMGSAYSYQDWSLVSVAAYFGLEIDGTGAITTTGGWPSSSTASGFINAAHQNNTRVLITVIAFSRSIHDGVLRNSTNKARLITNIVSQVQAGSADGVNIDFEMMSGSNRDYFTSFIHELGTALRSVNQDALLTIALPAVDWSAAFDMEALSSSTDMFFIMGYDYHWASGDPGPVSPLAGESYNLTRSTRTYRDAATGNAKVIVGVPYYGIDWPSESLAKGAKKRSNGTAKIYRHTINQSYTWDSATSVPWHAYTDSDGPHQLWFDNRRSIEDKIQMIEAEQADGFGMWAMAYDGSSSDLWTLLDQYYRGQPGPVPGSHELPFEVTTYPYSKSSSTSGKETIFDSYPPFSQNESGPEEIYELTVPSAGTLTVTLTDGSGIDVDIHLLSSLSSNACVTRNDSTFSYDVTAGTWYLACDTYAGSHKAGSYTVTIEFDEAALPGSHALPYQVIGFPYTRSSTTSGKETLFDSYPPYSQNESGPEEVYELTITSPGILEISLTDGSGVDVDIHLLSSLSSHACLARNDAALSYEVSPGTWYLVCDTYAGSHKAGTYTVSISMVEDILVERFDGNTSLSGWSRSSTTYVQYYTGSFKNGTAAMRVRYNASSITTVDTSGFKDIVIDFKIAAYSLETYETFYAEYNTGSGWETMGRVLYNEDNGSYKSFSVPLPASASNNSGLQLRFRNASSSSYDYGYVDDIVVSGRHR